MGAALTPGLALDYLHELSADVRAGAVLDAEGGRLAGPEALAAPAAAAVAALGEATEGQGLARDGAVFAVRDGERAVVVVCGPRALPGLARHDLGLVLADLRSDPATAGPRTVAPAPAPSVLPAAVVAALLSAAQSGAGDP